MIKNHQAVSGKKVAPYVIPTGGVSMPPALGPLTSGLACHLPSYAVARPTRRGNSAWVTPQCADKSICARTEVGRFDVIPVIPVG